MGLQPCGMHGARRIAAGDRRDPIWQRPRIGDGMETCRPRVSTRKYALRDGLCAVGAYGRHFFLRPIFMMFQIIAVKTPTRAQNKMTNIPNPRL